MLFRTIRTHLTGLVFVIALVTPLYVLAQRTNQYYDGQPDAWELAHGLNPNDASDAAIDSDGDGFTNLQEYFAGTDPQNSESALRITSAEEVDSDILISFTTVIGKIYRLERNDNFPSGLWTTVVDIIPGTGAIVQSTDSGAAILLSAVYRVILLPKMRA